MAKQIINRPDQLLLGKYFDIICSSPLDLRPLGRGSEKALHEAWKELWDEIGKIYPTGSQGRNNELIEDLERLNLRWMRIYAAIIGENYTHKASLDILAQYGVTASPEQDIRAIAKNMLNGLELRMKEIQDELENRPAGPTKKDCYAEVAFINRIGYTINTNVTTVAEFYGIKNDIRERSLKQQRNGQSDN